jgi:hypothetical protein
MTEFRAGENATKLAVAEFAMSGSEWKYKDGSALRDTDNGLAVITANYSAFGFGWQFMSFVAPIDSAAFSALTADERSTMPRENFHFGDIGECEAAALGLPAPQAPVPFANAIGI